MGRNVNFDSYNIGDIKQSFSLENGWLPCDGNVYLKSAYPELSNKIGNINLRDWYQYSLYDPFSENGIPNTYACADFKFLNNQYVFLTPRSLVILVSTDGINWTTRPIPAVPGATALNPNYPDYNTTNIPWRAIEYGNGIYVIVSDEYCSTSTDLINWSNPYKFNLYNDGSGNGWPVSSMTYGANIFVVAAGNYILTSNSNATNWIKRDVPLNMEILKVIYYPNPTDTNQSYFITISSCASTRYFDLNHGNTTYHNPETDAAIMYSKDGITWNYILIIPIFTNPIKYWGGFYTQTDRYSSYVLDPNYRPVPSNIIYNKLLNVIPITFANEAFMIYMYWDSFYPNSGTAHPFIIKYRPLPLADDWGGLLYDNEGNNIIVSRFGKTTLISKDSRFIEYDIKNLPINGRCGYSVVNTNTYDNILLDSISNYAFSYRANYNISTEFSVPNLNTPSQKFIIKGN